MKTILILILALVSVSAFSASLVCKENVDGAIVSYNLDFTSSNTVDARVAYNKPDYHNYWDFSGINLTCDPTVDSWCDHTFIFETDVDVFQFSIDPDELVRTPYTFVTAIVSSFFQDSRSIRCLLK